MERASKSRKSITTAIGAKKNGRWHYKANYGQTWSKRQFLVFSRVARMYRRYWHKEIYLPNESLQKFKDECVRFIVRRHKWQQNLFE